MAVRWNVTEHLRAKGWENAHQLSIGAGVSYPVAARILANEPMERLEIATLEALHRTFIPRSKTPWSLLKFDVPRRRPSSP